MEQTRKKYIELYDLYGSLLTDKQKVYFEDYYFLDLSISEIAENYAVSRNAVFDQIKRVTKALEEYEKNLKLRDKYNRIGKLPISKEELDSIWNILKE